MSEVKDGTVKAENEKRNMVEKRGKQVEQRGILLKVRKQNVEKQQQRKAAGCHGACPQYMPKRQIRRSMSVRQA